MIEKLHVILIFVNQLATLPKGRRKFLATSPRLTCLPFTHPFEKPFFMTCLICQPLLRRGHCCLRNQNNKVSALSAKLFEEE